MGKTCRAVNRSPGAFLPGPLGPPGQNSAIRVERAGCRCASGRRRGRWRSHAASSGLERSPMFPFGVIRCCTWWRYRGAVAVATPGLAGPPNRDNNAYAHDVKNVPNPRLDSDQDKTDGSLPGNSVDLDEGAHAGGPAEADCAEVEDEHVHGQSQSTGGHLGQLVHGCNVKFTGHGETGLGAAMINYEGQATRAAQMRIWRQVRGLECLLHGSPRLPGQCWRPLDQTKGSLRPVPKRALPGGLGKSRPRPIVQIRGYDGAPSRHKGRTVRLGLDQDPLLPRHGLRSEDSVNSVNPMGINTPTSDRGDSRSYRRRPKEQPCRG
jgi:hypothetical protein